MIGWARSLGSRLAAGVALAAAGGAAQAETFSFSGDAAGRIGVFETAQTGREFYGPRNFAPVPVADDGANFYFHRDTRSGELSLGIIADNRGDGTSGRLWGTITGLGATAYLSYSDDNNELRQIGPGSFEFRYNYVSCCVDGGVIGGLDPGNLAFTIDFTRVEGVTGGYLHGPSGTVSIGAPFAGASFAVAANPEPATWALFIVAFALTAAALKRARAPRDERIDGVLATA